jgi:uncharacterized protein YpmS
MDKILICLLLFLMVVSLDSIDNSLREQKQQPIVVQVTPDIERLDSINNALINKIENNSIKYDYKIDSISKSMRRIQVDYERIRKYSTMIP